MKTTISLIVLFCLFAGREIVAQEPDIAGSWTMFEMTWVTGDESDITNEDQLKDQGMFTDYSFLPEGKFTLVSNMTGSGKTETAEGNWKLEGDKLVMTFMIDENERDIIWDFEFKEDLFNLRRSSPDGSTSVVNSFKRK